MTEGGAGMPGTKRVHTARVSRAALSRKSSQRYILKLYVAGVNRKSREAIRTITEVCEEYLKGRYELTIIDIYQQPSLARGEQIIAVPTLIKKLPPPLRRLIGSMADLDKVLVGLDLRPKS
jgi:circadian clock protein KaiB